MPRSRRNSAAQRKLQFEQFEKRLVMSGQAVAPAIVESLPELAIAAPAVTNQDVVWQQSDTSPNQTASAADIAAQFGLSGQGQTIAVIDSGIAWDHHAFGGEFGRGHHVVGGWDFAENDANPYDDGPAGYHGSHVAGIIGSLDDQYPGVSAGADLVSLRVFDDQGAGNLDWVEQALQWVHENRNAFDNPITTVNLSLGTGWDPETTPGWGQLENEFAQLKQAGIFVSVAAGNGFKSLETVGLSYPAASQHVVPVASHGDNGQLSDFSQRDSNVLVAPGEMLRSAVPDHLFGGTAGNQFLASSGTSMAAPYVAGISSLLREANQFMGQDDVNQDLLYEQLFAAADRIYDQVTDQYYQRVDLRAALDQVITDQHAAMQSQATDLGQLDEGDLISGTIGRLDDVDAIQFRAAKTGRIVFDISATHELATSFELLGKSPASEFSHSDNQVSFRVTAGQDYAFKITTSAGTGHYDIATSYLSIPDAPAEDLGRIIDQQLDSTTSHGQKQFSLTTARSGLMSVQLNPIAVGNQGLTVEIFNHANQLIHTGTFTAHHRVDLDVSQGQQLRIKISSAEPNQAFEMRVSNLVSIHNETLTLHGTNGNDVFRLNHTATLNASINGIAYEFDTAQVNRFEIFGHGGEDQLFATLSDRGDNTTLEADRVYIGNDSFRLRGYGLERVMVDGGGGFDTVLMTDSLDRDKLTTNATTATLTGVGYSNQVSGFEIIHVKSGSQGGVDSAQLVGTAGNDRFATRAMRSTLFAGDFTLVVEGFENVASYGGGGYDLANLFGSSDSDQFQLGPGRASVSAAGYQVTTGGFEQINAFGDPDQDQLSLMDSQGRDSFFYRDGISVLEGSGYGIYADGFTKVSLSSGGGWDTAQIHGTLGNDTFVANTRHATLQAANTWVSVSGIENIGLIASQGGYDTATITGSEGDDRVFSDAESTRISSQHHVTRIGGMDSIQMDLVGGQDDAFVVGSQGRDRLRVNHRSATIESSQHKLEVTNLDNLAFDAAAGRDSIEVEGTINLLTALGDRAEAVLEQHKLTLENFEFFEATHVDEALAQYDMEAVEFIYLLRGNWDH